MMPLHKHQIHHYVSTVFHDMFAYHGLYQGQQAHTNLNFSHLPQDISMLYSHQERLDWKQLYYGQLTPLWITFMNVYHPSGQFNAIFHQSDNTGMAGSPKNMTNPEHPLTPGQSGTGRVQPTPGSSTPNFS